MNRYKSRKPKRQLRKFLIACLFVILTLSRYLYNQFNEGLKNVEKDGDHTSVKNEIKEFN